MRKILILTVMLFFGLPLFVSADELNFDSYVTIDSINTSKNIIWHEVNTLGENTVELNLSDNTKYYQYTYVKPDDYVTTSTRLDNNLDETNSKKVLFTGIKSDLSGGAIYNTQDKTSINILADFNNISTKSYGGAIYNSNGKLGNITGGFINNYAESSGGAIYNTSNSVIGDITGDFIGNYALSGTGYARGAAIFNNGSIGVIKGSFINNYTSGKGEDLGGAIFNNKGRIDSIKGNFIENKLTSTATLRGGAIYNSEKSYIGNIEGSFIKNKGVNTGRYQTMGGAIANFTGSVIESIKGNFIKNTFNSTKASLGGAISNNSESSIQKIEGNFVENGIISTELFVTGGAIYNGATFGELKGDFIRNYASTSGTYASGGAICNNGTIENIQGSFIGNYSKTTSSDYKALGGAIYTIKDLNFLADNYQSVFSGNYTESNGVKDDNAIYVNSADAILTFQTTNNGSVVMNDNIDGVEGYQVNITGDNTGTFYLFNDIRNAGVTTSNTTLNTVNNKIREYNFNSFTVTGDTNMVVDVNLKNKSMDRITSKTYGEHQGKLIVTGMNLMSDAVKETTTVAFAEEGLKDNVETTIKTVGANSGNKYQTKVFAPIFKYDVSYDPANGNFMFVRGSGSSSNDFNPAVLSTPANVQTGAYVSQIQTFSQAFQHADNFMNVPSTERAMIKHQNKYASTNVGVFSPLMSGSEDKGFWVKPYAIFENVPLKNGPKVNAITYGTLIGYDEPMKNLKHGWDMVSTYYVGYNGSSQSYSGVDTYQNGGLLGSTLTLYKGNFFNATTLSVGATVGENHTMYGSDTFTSLVAGIGNKTGYNIEFKDGRFIVQPSMLLAYTFINTFDYTNAAGVKINSDPMSAIQIAPTMKFIANTKKGWQPYLTVGMVWNILAHSQVTANDVTLPNMSIKPYVQYGLGIQKRFKDRLLAFGQAIIYNGGRNGVLLNVGLRWSIGK